MKKIFFLLLLSGTQLLLPAQNQPKPFVLGVTDQLHSTILGEDRTLNIYLPEGYDAKDSARYPVIYLLDGAADEDFIHVVGLVQFNTFSWVNRLPKSIVVGIANTQRRRDLTYPTTVTEDQKNYPDAGGSARFISFLEKELQPYITKQYKTDTHKTIIGESLGGLLATQVLLEKPQLFDTYIIISPSLWWDNGSLLKKTSVILNPDFKAPLSVYIGVGKEGITPGPNPHVQEVDANLLADKLKATKSKSVHTYFDYLPEEDHATIGHQALYNAFRILSKMKKGTE